ncbi:MAG: alpha-amylase, partial [Clostridiales bacterium]|nr:alpha-amylase [Candidatus Blautia equi]
HLHKALYSSHNDHNYFETAHTVRRLNDLGRNNGGGGLKLYNFVDNHDVERIYTKLNNKAHFVPTHVLLYTLPGIPSVYYGSEFGMEGRKERFSDDSLRPYINLDDYKDAVKNNWCTAVVSKLGKARQQLKALAYGNYTEHTLTTRQYAFSRNCDGQNVLVTVNNDDNSAWFNLPADGIGEYVGVLSGKKIHADNGRLNVEVSGNSGEVWVPAGSIVLDGVLETESIAPYEMPQQEAPAKEAFAVEQQTVVKKAPAEKKEEPAPVKPAAPEPVTEEPKEAPAQPAFTAPVQPVKEAPKSGRILDDVEIPAGKSLQEMTVVELQKVIYEKMKKNGPVTDRMYQDIIENVYHNSLVGWANSFR